MRLPRLINEFFKWRWAPCVALIAGSLAFVALALLIIPMSAGTTAVANSNSFERTSPGLSTMFGASLARGSALASVTRSAPFGDGAADDGLRRAALARQVEAATAPPSDTSVPSLTPVVPVPADAVPATAAPAPADPDAPRREN